eukprot:gnl/TRDRNA2_/TRDRNA2_142796_c0_seq1.p1 gnl/TRDRNA2_/TRDRNA2_142796_c0~~gnl/TRDRNA2_/TRDRNA2_142796_c0_seq1.p1  ORF type:complete len:422 (+),score=53.72 gnl/TRDRNA2_/TRDRNA2_142796_c0_seq1:61-1266(+)
MADIDCTDVNGQTPLMRACFRGHLEAVRLLVQRAADVGKQDNRGVTARAFAAKQKHTRVVAALSMARKKSEVGQAKPSAEVSSGPSDDAQATESRGLARAKPEDYVRGRLLGKGSYGDVFAATDRTGRMVAMKVLKWPPVGSDSASKVPHEVTMLRKLGEHHALVRLLDFVQGVREALVVFELFPTTLQKVINSGLSDLSAGPRRSLLGQLVDGVAFLHGQGVLHRDLSPTNVLIGEALEPKAEQGDEKGEASGNGLRPSQQRLVICDFGSAHSHVEGALAPRSRGTLWYRGPELMGGSAKVPLSFTSDMWSVGCLLGELLLRKPMFPGNDGSAMGLLLQPVQVLTKRAEVAKRGVPAEREALAALLADDPSERWSAQALRDSKLWAVARQAQQSQEPALT